MASIQRIKSPLTGAVAYRVQIRVKGKPTLSETFPNKKEAKEWGDATETDIRQGKHFPHLKAAKTTFATLVDRYETSVLKDAKAKLQLGQRQHLAWWSERFVGKTLAEITPDVIAEARDELAAEKFTRGKPHTDKKTGEVRQPAEYTRSAATVNKYLRTLSRVFNLAKREWKLIGSNPVADISKKKEARGRTRFLSDDERDRLLKACGESSWPALRVLVLLALTTGARRGELIGLKWDDVDLKVGDDGKAGRVLVRESKNGEQRTLPLAGKALEALRALKLQGSARSEWVFPQPSGFPGHFEYFDAHWYAAVEAAGLKDFRFHDLRHTTASMLAAQGASLLEIADVLGHRTLSMVKRYSHLVVDHKTKVIEKMVAAKGL